MSKGPKAPTRRRSRLLALEPRVLFDGAAVDSASALARPADADPAAMPADALLDAIDRALVPPAVEAPAAFAPAPVEWLVIDGAVPDAQQLLAQARAGLRVLLLQSDQDGLAQI